MSPQGMLPVNVIQLIREYSKPLTNPSWRTLQPMPFQRLYTELIEYRYKQKRDVLYLLYNKIHNYHTIGRILYYNTYYNIYISSIMHDIPENILYGISLYFQPFIEDDPEFIFKYRYYRY